jgi:hypothetical protein
MIEGSIGRRRRPPGGGGVGVGGRHVSRGSKRLAICHDLKLGYPSTQRCLDARLYRRCHRTKHGRHDLSDGAREGEGPQTAPLALAREGATRGISLGILARGHFEQRL